MNRGRRRTGVTDFVVRRVKQRRKHLGLTQERFADAVTALGAPFPRGSVAKLETGRLRVDVEDLVMFARVLDVEPAYFLPSVDGMSEPMVPLSALQAFVAKWGEDA